MPKEINKKTGVITEALPSLSFRVRFEDGQEAIAHLAGRLRIHKISILVGDRVLVEMSPYDNSRGRIVYRLK